MLEHLATSPCLSTHLDRDTLVSFKAHPSQGFLATSADFPADFPIFRPARRSFWKTWLAPLASFRLGARPGARSAEASIQRPKLPVWVKIKAPGIGPQVLVPIPIYHFGLGKMGTQYPKLVLGPHPGFSIYDFEEKKGTLNGTLPWVSFALNETPYPFLSHSRPKVGTGSDMGGQSNASALLKLWRRFEAQGAQGFEVPHWDARRGRWFLRLVGLCVLLFVVCFQIIFITITRPPQVVFYFLS